MDNMHTNTTKTKPSPVARLISLLKPERADLGVIVFFSVLTGLLYLATPLAVDAVVQNIAFGGQQHVYVQTLLIFSVTLLLFLGLLSLVSVAQHFVAELIQQRIFARLAADLAYRLPRVRMSEYEGFKTQELVNRFLDVTTIQKSSAYILLDGVNAILSTCIGLLVLAFYHPFLLGFDFFLVITLLVVLFPLGRNGVKTSIQESYAKHSVAGWFEQMVMFPTLFRDRAGKKVSLDKANGLVDNYLTQRKAHYRVLIRQILGLFTLQAIASASLLAMGGSLVLQGELTLGQLVASELIVSAIVYSLVGLSKHIEIWYDALAAIDKHGSLVDLKIERQSGKPVSLPDAPYSVRVEDLSFAFSPNRPLFEGLNLEVKAGEKLGITGIQGSGTGTLLQLIYGLHEYEEGLMEINGIDLRYGHLDTVRDRVVYLHNVELFEGTIEDNIRMGREDIPIEELMTAMRQVGLNNLLKQDAQGLDRSIQLGGRPLSEGQRLRLCVARALLAKPRLVLIDKLLDGMDPIDSQQLMESILTDNGGCTLIIASRDPHILARCDRVLEITGKGQLDKADKSMPNPSKQS